MLIINEKKKRSELEAYSPPEVTGNRIKLIPYKELADTLIDCIKASEFKIVSESWYVNSTGSLFYGAVDIIPSSMGGPELEELGYFSLAFRSSYNTKYAISFIAGAKVEMATDPTIFSSGELAITSRQIESLVGGDLLELAVNRFLSESDHVQKRINKLKSTPINLHRGFGLIVGAAMQDIIPFRSVEYVSKELLVATDEQTYWGLYKAFRSSYSKLGVPGQYVFCKEIYRFLLRMMDEEK